MQIEGIYIQRPFIAEGPFPPPPFFIPIYPVPSLPVSLPFSPFSPDSSNDVVQYYLFCDTWRDLICYGAVALLTIALMVSLGAGITSWVFS